MANLGRALNLAIPRSIESISAIQGLEERAKEMRMEEELQPYRMENLQAETTLNQMTVQQRAYELNKQKELINLSRQPRTVGDLLSFAGGVAPKTTEKWKQKLVAGGAVDNYGLSSAEKFMLWGQANPLEFQSLAFEGVNEIEQSIAEKGRLIGGYTDEKGKFVPPDKNAPILQNQIQQLRNTQQWLIGTMGSEFQQKLELEKVKQGQAGMEQMSDTQLYSILNNSTDPAEKKRAADMLEFRRAQAPEVYSTTGAREKAVTEYAQPKAYETKTGTEKADFASKFPQQRNLMSTLNQQWDLVNTNIDEAKKLIGLHTTGYGSWLKYIPATDARLLDNKLEMIRSNIGFDTLREMRAQSPTGGALGQVSEWENKLTQAVKGVLDQSLSGKDLKKTLNDIKTALKNVRKVKNESYQKDYGTFLNQQKGGQTETKILNGKTYQKIDGQWYEQ